MGFESDVDQDIVQGVTDEYKRAALWLPFSALEIKAVFDSAELATLSEFMGEMRRRRMTTRANKRCCKRSRNTAAWS